jgi:hypothetical protein
MDVVIAASTVCACGAVIPIDVRVFDVECEDDMGAEVDSAALWGHVEVCGGVTSRGRQAIPTGQGQSPSRVRRVLAMWTRWR